MKGKNLLLIFLFLLSSPLSVLAQNYSDYTWYFCNRTVEFNRTNKNPNTGSITTPVAGPTAVAADPATGNILFYTDGVNIYDASNQVMVNGGGLLGNPAATQPPVIGQVPGQPNQYYVLTLSAAPAPTIRTTIVDMSIQGNGTSAQLPLGAVVNASKNTVIGALTNQSPGMITIPHANGTDFWLISHSANTSTYNVTHFSVNGVENVTAYPAGLITSVANFTYNAESNLIAVSPAEANRNVEILNFDPASGTITLEGPLPLSNTSSTPGVYDVEWSPNGDYLYISSSGPSGQPELIQYDLSNLNPPGGLITPISILPQPNAITASYGLQTGPDGNIYHLYQAAGQIRMGVINEPDSAAALVQYQPQAFTGSFCTTQFSSSLPAHAVDITIDFEGAGCANVPTQLFPSVSPAADSLQWFITGEAEPFSSAWSPVHTFDQAGPVSITVVAYLGGEPTSYEETINIQNFDTQITLEPEVTGCHDEFTEPRVKPPGWVPCGPGGTACLTVEAQIQGTQGTIRWFGPDGEIAGANSTTLTPPSPGYYYIVVGDGPCFAYAGVNVKEYDVPDPRANVWYFGNGAGLDFNPLFRDPAEPIGVISGPMNAPEGTATISDRNGQAILYTDGQTVWNKDNQVVATNIGGSQTATQSSLIMAVPGDETLYYIFTTQEIEEGTFELRYTLFDLKLNGGTGGIVDPDNNPATNPPSTVLFTRSTERLAAVGDFLIAHEYGTNTFRAYRVTPQGISAPVISNVGSDHNVTDPVAGEGYMSYGSGRLAVALNNSIEVFDYDAGSGEISNVRTIAAPGQVYGVNFSTSGNKMFVTLLNNPGQIIEYYYDEDLDTYVQMPNPIVMTGYVGSQPGAMQYGPDGQLYVAIVGSNTLGAILPQDDQNTPSTFQADATPALSGNVTLGLPNFVQQVANPIQEPGVTVPVVCINTEAEFVASGKDSTIDEYAWEFSGGIVPDAPDSSSVRITVATPGTYTVRVKIWNKCEGSEQAPYFDELITFEVHDVPPPPPMLNGDPGFLCDANGITLFGAAADTPGTTYEWNTGSDQRTIQVNTPGRYSVIVTNEHGCVNQGSALVIPYFGNVTLGPDVNICEDQPYQIEIASVYPNATWTWFENGVQQPAPRVPNVYPVNTSTAGQRTIRLELSDASCTFSDEVIVDINPVPLYSRNLTDDADCDPLINDGRIEIIPSPPAGIPLTYSVVGGSAGFSQSGNTSNPGTVAVNNLAGDTYNLTLTDTRTGCATNEVISINNNTFAFNAAESGTCHPNMAIDVEITLNSGTNIFDYRVFDSSADLVRGQDNITGTPNFTSEPLPPQDDQYTISVTNSDGCVASRTVSVEQDQAYDILIDNAMICTSNEVEMVYVTQPPNGAIPSWTATTPQGTGNGIVSFTGNRATLAVGTWVVTVNASGPTACPATATRTVIVSPPLTADFVQSDECEAPVVLTGTPTGSQFLYRWTRNNAATPFASTANVSLTPADDGSSFQLRVINTQNGCTDDSENRVARVIEPFTVSLTLPPFACEGTQFQVVATATRPDVVQFQWFLNGGALPQTGPVLTTNQAGTYRVIGSLLGCVSPPVEGNLTPNPAPQVSLGSLRRLCPYPGPEPTRTVTIDAGPGFASYEWFAVQGNAVTPLNITAQQLVAESGGVYRVEVTDADGCPNTAEVEVVQECDPIIAAPTAFRPGSSVSENEGFAVITQFITDEDFQVLIFNRWGEMVFESSNRAFRWNGGYRGNGGQILPPGTYAYVVRYKSEYFPEQGVKEKRGGVVLVR